MRVLLLGTGGYHPNERRHTACVMLPETGVVFDAGTSFFRVTERLETRELQVFLSHAHLDHVVGVTFPIVAVMKGDLDRIRVYGSEPTLAAVRRHLLAESLFPVALPKVEFVEPGDRVPVAHGGQLTSRPLDHPGGSTGYRIDWPGTGEHPPRSIAYITDTTAPGDYSDFIRGVDLLIHECNFGDDMSDWALKTGHSNTTAVTMLARDADVGQLVLTHIDPQRPDDDPVGLEAARKIFPRTILAEDLMEIEV